VDGPMVLSERRSGWRVGGPNHLEDSRGWGSSGEPECGIGGKTCEVSGIRIVAAISIVATGLSLAACGEGTDHRSRAIGQRLPLPLLV
jgi:hypothetical protein